MFDDFAGCFEKQKTGKHKNGYDMFLTIEAKKKH